MCQLPEHPADGAPTCDESYEEDLFLYVDGELAFAKQPLLFAHLAACASCRASLEALLKFRLVSREEHLAVPSACDELFLKRLARQKEVTRTQPIEERTSLWRVQRFVSVRTAVVALVLVFTFGFMLSGTPDAGTAAGAKRKDRVREAAAPVYVIYPGVTIEESR